MSKKFINVMVFDTETIGMSSQLVENIGYKIVKINLEDFTYKVLCERDLIVKELYDNTLWTINDILVSKKKLEMYKENLENGTAKKHKFSTIANTIARDIEKWKVNTTYAFNNNFDKRVFSQTCEHFQTPNPLLENFINGRCFDLMAMASIYIVDTPDYIAWAEEHQKYTDSRAYIKATVEVITQYLLNDLDFVEDHTGLSDVEHELRILVECLRRKAVYEYHYETTKVKTGLPKTTMVNGREEKYKKVYVDLEGRRYYCFD